MGDQIVRTTSRLQRAHTRLAASSTNGSHQRYQARIRNAPTPTTRLATIWKNGTTLLSGEMVPYVPWTVATPSMNAADSRRCRSPRASRRRWISSCTWMWTRPATAATIRALHTPSASWATASATSATATTIRRSGTPSVGWLPSGTAPTAAPAATVNAIPEMASAVLDTSAQRRWSGAASRRNRSMRPAGVAAAGRRHDDGVMRVPAA